MALIEFMRADHSGQPHVARATTTAASPAPPPPPATEVTVEATDTVTDTVTTTPAGPPPAVIGANCAPVDATAATETGATAYCASVPGSGSTIWSLSRGEVPSPTSTPTPDPTETPLPAEEAFPVLTCMAQTGQTRRECRQDIRRSNGLPALP